MVGVICGFFLTCCWGVVHKGYGRYHLIAGLLFFFYSIQKGVQVGGENRVQGGGEGVVYFLLEKKTRIFRN